MKTSIRSSAPKKYITLLLCCSMLCMNAQIKKAFEPRFSETVNGNVTMIANNMLSRHATNNYNGSSGNHDFNDNVFVDIDSDNSTFNSSNADFNNPEPAANCLVIKKAYLYWAAADYEENDSDDEPNWNYNQVKLMLPGSVIYNTLTADNVIYRGRDEHFVNDPYICFKDITTEVKNLSSAFGTYQLANVRAKKGALNGHGGGNVGTSGGWEIVFIYENPTLPKKNITIFDGYAHVTSSVNNFEIEFNGFQTVPTGDVNTNIVLGALEGDKDLTNDRLQIKNVADNWVDISTPNRPSSNFFNSKITKDGTDFITRNPASLNTLGFDAGVFALNNTNNTIIANNQTSAILRMTSDQETYGLFLLGLAIDVWEPNVAPIVLQTNIAPSTIVNENDNVNFNFDIQNTGNDDAVNLVIEALIPEEVDFISANTIPGVTSNYNPVTRMLTFTVTNDGLTTVNSPLFTLGFNIKVKDKCYFLETKCSNTFQIHLQATYNGVMNPKEVIINSSSGTDNCGIGNNLPNIFTINQPALVNWSTVENALNTTIECNDTQGLLNAQALIPELEDCNLIPVKTAGDFVPSGLCGSNGTYTNTWIFTDICGRESSIFTQLITIQDAIPPTVSTVAGSLDATLECDDASGIATALTLEPSATDTCTADPTLNLISDETTEDANCANAYVRVRTWNFTDGCGNTSTDFVQTISIYDNSAPDITSCNLAANTALNCDATTNEANADQWNADNIAALQACATDNCDTDLTINSNYNFANLNQECGPCGTLSVTYDVIDNCGNNSPITLNLSFNDNTPPDLSNCSVVNGTLECDGANNEAIADQWNADNIAALEACAEDDTDITVTSNYIYTNLNTTCGLGGTIPITYTVTDECGGAAVLNVVLTLEDTTPPDLSGCTVTSQTLECDGANNETIADQWNLDNIVALETCVGDNCDPDFSGQVTSDYTYSNLSSTCGLGGTITVIYTITDDCGNAEILNATLTLEDTTPPDLSACAVTSEALECDGANNETIADQWNFDNIVALETCIGDSCTPDFSGQVTSDYAYSNLSSTCGLGGTIAVIYTITDDCGNTEILNATLTLEDTTPPDLSGCTVTSQALECDGANNEIIADQWNADNIAALEGCVGDSCDPDFSGQVTSDYAYSNLSSTCGLGGTIVVIYIITDDCGNAEILNATLTLEDTTPPDLSGCTVTSQVLECTDDNEAAADAWNIANIAALEACVSDSCDLDFSGQVTSDYEFSNLNTTCGPCGTLSVNYTITDDCGNSSNLNAILSFDDITIPDLSDCNVNDLTLECDGDNNVVLADQWNADNIAALEACADDLNITVSSNYAYTNLVTSCGLGGTIPVTYTVTDDCDNSAILNVTLTLEDTTPPDLVNCTVTDETLECDGANNETKADQWNADNITALETCGTDSCDIDNTFVVTSDYAFTNLNGTCGAGGTITVTYTVSDDCNNSQQLTATLTLEDTTPPDLVNCTITDETLECTADGNEAIADQWNADNIAALQYCATDACDIDNTFVVTSDYDFVNLNLSCGPCGAIIVNYTISDDCGNETTLTATLTLSDDTNPDLTNCNVEDITIECSGIDNESIADAWNADNIAALENCADDIAVTITSDYAFTNLSATCGAGGTITVVYTATDDCDNSVTLQATLTLEDTTPPDLVNCTVVDTTLECAGTDNESIADAWNADNIAALQTCGTDACDVDNTYRVTSDYDFTQLSSDCGVGGTITVIYTVSDDCNNSQTLTATLTLNDSTPPLLTQGDDGSAECTGTAPSINQDYIDWVSSYAGITATDNCGSVTLSFIEGQWTNDGCSDSITVTFIAVDQCGIQAIEVERTFTISDTTPPEITPEIQEVVFYCNELPPVPVFDIIEECSEETNVVYTVTIDGVEGASDYKIIRSWIITDYCGNETIRQQTLLVEPGCDCLEDKFISKAITPNGDIYNDYFKVEGIDDCGTPTLKIFNRWGNLVYQSADYDSKKGRWRGTAENGGTTIGRSNKLPTGTYYYIIEIRNSNIKPLTGHVYLSTK